MVYRTGTDGMGYYPDVAAITPALLHQELFPLAGIAPCATLFADAPADHGHRAPRYAREHHAAGRRG